jgi:hypothetical protein
VFPNSSVSYHAFKLVAKIFIISSKHNIILQIWVGDNIDDKQQQRAPKGTTYMIILQFPLKKIRKDCTYLSTPAMKIPETMKNVHTCEVITMVSVTCSCKFL